jgi:hypothetical protein
MHAMHGAHAGRIYEAELLTETPAHLTQQLVECWVVGQPTRATGNL